MVITFLVKICQSVVGLSFCPSDHLWANVTREELMDKSDNALVHIEIVKLITIVMFRRFTCRTPVPQFCTETVKKEVHGQSDVFFGVNVHDESLVSSKKKKNVDQDSLV